MTYCVGMIIDAGLVFMADTRTNAGVDNISTFKKLTTWSKPGKCVMTLLSSGNLATTQALTSLLEERSKAADDGKSDLLGASSMFQAAQLVADTLKEVIDSQTGTGPVADGTFSATVIFGGQVAGEPPRLFMIYPEGNFIEAGDDTPFFQIGETKYGRPILVRAYDRTMSFEEAMKLLMVSFDSTVRANLSVGPPFDFHAYPADSLKTGREGRIGVDESYLVELSSAWSDALKVALDSLPDFRFPEDR